MLLPFTSFHADLQCDAENRRKQRYGKGIGYNTFIAPHTAAAAALLCHRQSGRTAQTYRPYRLSLRPQTFTCNQTAIRSPGLPFNGLHPRNEHVYSLKKQQKGQTEGQTHSYR